MWFQSIDPDPLEAVNSVLPGYHFYCPDVGSVDQHITELREHIGPDSNLTPKRKEAARQDIDRLLERRLYLTLAGDGSGGAGQHSGRAA